MDNEHSFTKSLKKLGDPMSRVETAQMVIGVGAILLVIYMVAYWVGVANAS